MTLGNPALCLFLDLTGVHFWGELQHGGDVSQQKIKCRPIRTREIGGVSFSDVLYEKQTSLTMQCCSLISISKSCRKGVFMLDFAVTIFSFSCQKVHYFVTKFWYLFNSCFFSDGFSFFSIPKISCSFFACLFRETETLQRMIVLSRYHGNIQDSPYELSVV